MASALGHALGEAPCLAGSRSTARATRASRPCATPSRRTSASADEIGAGVAIALDGELVVDLWGGHADRARTRALAARHARQRLLDDQGHDGALRAPARRRGQARPRRARRAYWPEFAQAGKGALPVRWLLSHRAGLAARARRCCRTRRSTTGTRCAAALAARDAVVGAGQRARLPRGHVRLAGRRGGAPHRGQAASARTSATSIAKPLGARPPHRPARGARARRASEPTIPRSDAGPDGEGGAALRCARIADPRA